MRCLHLLPIRAWASSSGRHRGGTRANPGWLIVWPLPIAPIARVLGNWLATMDVWPHLDAVRGVPSGTTHSGRMLGLGRAVE